MRQTLRKKRKKRRRRKIRKGRIREETRLMSQARRRFALETMVTEQTFIVLQRKLILLAYVAIQ